MASFNLRAATTPIFAAGKNLPLVITSRSYSSDHPKPEKRYSFNYQKLKEGGFFSSGSKTADLFSQVPPETVSGNVKNVQGFKGGAERGFLGVYPDCIHQIVNSESKILSDWTTKVLTHNLSTSVLGKTRFGMLVPITYYQLSSREQGPDFKNEMRLAHVAGWGVELIRANQYLTADTLKFRGHRHILSQTQVEPDNTWAEKHNLGVKAFNDALLLQNGCLTLFHENMKNHPAFGYILDAVTSTIKCINSGRATTLRINDLAGGVDKKMSQINASMYKRIIYENATVPRYILPVRLALYLKGLNSERMHAQAAKVLEDVGFLAEITGDFANCFYDVNGTDIENGRMTWLLANAYQRASPSQKTVLERSYGVHDVAKSALVRQVYDDLKLKKTVSTDIDMKRDELLEKINHVSSLSRDTLTPNFFFQLLDYMSAVAWGSWKSKF